MFISLWGDKVISLLALILFKLNLINVIFELKITYNLITL